MRLNQLLKNPRISKETINRTPDLKQNPQKKGTCTKVFIMHPRKPNSANRKVARVKIGKNTRRLITAYIPGIGHNLKEYSTVLIRGGRAKDLPGVKYTLVRGKYDFEPCFSRKTSRSQYGLKRKKEEIKKK
jgi:small subunit ribosomal protein S12